MEKAMKEKNDETEDYNLSSDAKKNDRYSNLNILRIDNELFKDEDNVIHDIITVKHIFLRKEEAWEIFSNEKLVLTLRGKSFTKNEKKFLSTPEGMNYIISSFKDGTKTGTKLIKKIKKRAP